MNPAGRGPRRRRPSRLSEGTTPRALDYELTYPGKTAPSEVIAGPKGTPVHRLSVRLSTGAGANRLYCGDNLAILRALCDDPDVCGRVALVYIDPPFATGALFECRQARRAYDDTAQGAAFIEFLRQRVILLRELLAPHGSLYLHLDSRMAFPMKVVLDEVFGPAGFRNWITRKKSNRKNFTRKQFGNIADYILFYTKTDSATFNRAYEPWTEGWAKTEYPCVEPGTGRRYKKVPVHAPGVRNGETGQPWRGKLPPPGKHWQYPPAVLDELDARGGIYWSPTGNPRRMIYLEQSPGVPVQDVWMEFRDAHNQNVEVTGYPTEKNLGLLRRIVAASSDPGDLVMDAFAGSGTTLVAAEELGRRWIGVDASVHAVDTTINRLARGAEPLGDFVRSADGTSARTGPRQDERPRRVLTTGFDLYTGEGAQPDAPGDDVIARWAGLFQRESDNDSD